MGESRGVYRVWWGGPEGKRTFGRHMLIWEDNIKMYLQEVCCGHWLEQSGSGQEQVAGTCKYGNKLSGPIKCGEFLD
jgi:hypothetical protein